MPISFDTRNVTEKARIYVDVLLNFANDAHEKRTKLTQPMTESMRDVALALDLENADEDCTNYALFELLCLAQESIDEKSNHEFLTSSVTAIKQFNAQMGER